MKIMFKFLIALVVLFFAVNLQAQKDDDTADTTGPTESSGVFLDDIVERTLTLESKILPYESLREADIPWSKKVWRIIETREKVNLPFRNEVRPFFTILVDDIADGKISAFKDDEFKEMMTAEEVKGEIFRIDSVPFYDPDTYEETVQIVKSEINPGDIKRFRIKEVWYFDKESSVFKVRILGISPLREVMDDATGELKYEIPMFWVYYPELREYLASEAVPSDYNDSYPMTWYDLFENRMFSSYIMKINNILDLRIEHNFDQNSDTYNMDILLESERIKQELFNFEHDLWSY